MFPDLIQQQLIEARLNRFLGVGEYDRLCLGMTVGPLQSQVLYVFVADASKASELQEKYSVQISVAATSAMQTTVSAVRVLPTAFDLIWHEN